MTVAGTLTIALVLAFFLARSITRPVRLLHKAAARVSRGERDLRVCEAGADELGSLAREFNQMTAALAAREDELKAHADMLEQRVAEKTEALSRRDEELTRSNQELERFAYVASHDLQEPLRMVASYTQLLGRRYRGKLDAEADEFIAFAVDGAQRMQALINDLLAYSRVGTKGQALQPTDCQAVLERALGNLTMARRESEAVITCDALPTVVADATQLAQMFQNLVGNAIKFRGPRRPEVHIGARRGEAETVLYVRDNGIGIDPAYVGQLFVLFRRLHSVTEYPGTGIGLAICKKIVDRHGGRIWVESTLGVGSTFFFSLPDRPADTQPAAEQFPLAKVA
jgi:light-regulated signal transduction histidine kinase (bacteriophytochrome)